jgi:hypothetical protein
VYVCVCGVLLAVASSTPTADCHVKKLYLKSDISLSYKLSSVTTTYSSHKILALCCSLAGKEIGLV